MTAPARYHGLTRRGVAATGVTGSPAAFVEEKFRAGWRKLIVTQDGRDIGRIERHPDTGRRTWWVER